MTTEPHYLETELEELIAGDPAIWRFVQEGSLDGVWYWDLERPDQEYMSPEFWRLFGFDPATKSHDPAEWQDLIFEEDLAVASENLQRHIEDPNHPYDQVVRYRCADGSTAWVRCRGIAVRDESGRAIRLLGAHNDITSLKHEEQQNRAVLGELETIFDAVTSGIVALDREGRIVRINQRARHMLGGISDPVPLDWPATISFVDAETMAPLDSSADPIRRALSGHQLRNETHLMNRTGAGDERRYVRVASAAVRLDDDDSDRIVLVIDDVSNEERNRQVVERKNRLDALGQLTGGIAHDFNNVLASQLYAIDLARNATDPTKRDEYFDVARGSIERGRSLTARLLAFARRQPGLATARNTVTVLEEFEGLVRPMLETSIDLSTNTVDEDLHHYCDQAQLETAMMNLVLNSRDAILRAGKGSRIEVSARAAADPEPESHGSDPDPVGAEGRASRRYVEISIADNGPGMDSETVARCTDPFFTTKDSNSGTGLGLAMVYGFLRQADGDLRIYSEVGVGTTVQMLLPRGSASGNREEKMADEAPDLGQGQTILLVEDELQLLDVITDVIEDLGYRVIAASSGADALALVEQGQAFDLLLTDVVMPGEIGGFELARRVKQLRPDVPVLYASGYAGYSEEEMGEVQAPIVQKPAMPRELADAIRLALS